MRMKKRSRATKLIRNDSKITCKKLLLRRKRLTDAWNDYNWERDPELAYLDAVPPLTITFNQYLVEYVGQLNYPPPTRNRFAIETIEGEHIGNCSYYNIDQAKGEAELGIMIGNHGCWDKGYGSEVVTILVGHVFRETNIKRIYLKTLDTNCRAQKCFQKCGFVPYGHMNNNGFSFILMEIYRDSWQERQTSP